MAKIYIPYGSVEGQTAQIVEYVADVIRAHGHEAETVDLKHAGHTLPGGQDGVIESYVVDFVRKNLAELERLPAALISVSLAAHGDEQNAESYVAEFEEQTTWRPATWGSSQGRCSTPATTSSNASP